MLMKWIRQYSVSPLQPLIDVRDSLVEFRRNLDNIQRHLVHHQADGIDLIPRFFHEVSNFQDSNIVRPLIKHFTTHNKHGEYATPLKELDALYAHVENAGRKPCAMNRTVVGQAVTDDDVYLGDIYGYHTKTVAYIKSERTDQEYYRVMNGQATAFMKGHLPMMISCLTSLIEAAQSSRSDYR